MYRKILPKKEEILLTITVLISAADHMDIADIYSYFPPLPIP